MKNPCRISDRGSTKEWVEIRCSLSVINFGTFPLLWKYLLGIFQVDLITAHLLIIDVNIETLSLRNISDERYPCIIGISPPERGWDPILLVIHYNNNIRILIPRIYSRAIG